MALAYVYIACPETIACVQTRLSPVRDFASSTKCLRLTPPASRTYKTAVQFCTSNNF